MLTSPSFKTSGDPAPLRPRYVTVHPVIHRIFDKQLRDGTVFILPLAEAQSIPGVHLHNFQHWTRKKGKPQGRAIADLSNTPDQFTQTPINGRSGEERSDLNARYNTTYGVIKHPSLIDLMLMILTQADQHGWENISLWKKDLQGAFNLLWFNPLHVQLLGFPLVGGLVIFHLVGLFGLAGMPHAFQVLTRAIEAALTKLLRGLIKCYVDDIMGCSAFSTLVSDQHRATNIITKLLGPSAVAVEKDEAGRSLEFIGWIICLDSCTVSASPRYLLKVLHAFFSCDINNKISLLQLQRMASHASRLSMLCPFMAPFTRNLYTASTLFDPLQPCSLRELGEGAQGDVTMWQAFLIIMRAPTTLFRRSIHSFRLAPPTMTFEYDASLEGLGVGISSSTTGLLAYTAVDVPFATHKDASNQNTCEYMAILLGLLLAHYLHLQDFTYELRGDSVSSLTWAILGRASSSRACRANIGMAIASLNIRAFVHNTVHVPGVDNVVYDGLSRKLSGRAVGLDPSKQLFFPASHSVTKFLTLCDPGQPLLSTTDCLTISAQFTTLLLTMAEPV